jgi:hypothetical protein
MGDERCAAYLVTVLIHLKNVAYVVSLRVMFLEIGRAPGPVDSVQGENMKRTSLKQFSNRARSLSSL